MFFVISDSQNFLLSFFRFQYCPVYYCSHHTRSSRAATYFLFLLVWGLYKTAFCQQNVAHQYNGWYCYVGNHILSSQIGLHTEYQWRRSEIIHYNLQHLFRIGLDYQIFKNITLTAGYAFIKTYPYGKQPVPLAFNEHRIWQQIFLNRQAGRWYFQHRFRLEQRWMENIRKNIAGDPIKDGFVFKNRARYLFVVNIPLSKKQMMDNTLFLSFQNEIFVHIGHNSGPQWFDQNRFYIAPGWFFSKTTVLLAGYMNQYIQKANGKDFEDNHTLVVWIRHHLVLKKKPPTAHGEG